MTRHDKSELFRREALKRLDDIDELDHLVTVTHPRAWLALGAVAALIIAAVVWASFGRLETTVGGQGVLLRGGHTSRVTTVGDGRLTDLLVGVGDTVAIGQPVAVVIPASRLEAFQEAEEEVVRAGTLLRDLTASSGATREEVADARAALDKARRSLSRARSAATGAAVTSPYAGVVVSLQAQKGQYVAPGAPIVTVEPMGKPLVATLYLPIEDGKNVAIGQPVQIVPTNVAVDEYGYLLGTVKSVAGQASTPESMDADLQNAFLVRQFSSTGPVLRIEAALDADPDTRTGYAWSSSSGPDETLSTGTIVAARVVLSTAPPITYAFPALGRLFGGEE